MLGRKEKYFARIDDMEESLEAQDGTLKRKSDSAKKDDTVIATDLVGLVSAFVSLPVTLHLVS